MMRWIALAMTVAVSTATADSTRTLRPLARTARANARSGTEARHRITTDRPRELSAVSRAIDPAIARAVLAPRLTDHASVVEQPATWVDPAKPAAKKPRRPRILPLPMSSPTGGSGVKVKLRF